MDRREAMLREMNLYPLWVRRDIPETEPAASVRVDEAEAIQQAVHAEIQVAHEAPPAELLSYELADVELPQSGADTLREFQSKMAAGPLADVNWPELKQKVAACVACPLRAGCQQTVFGVGDEQADWLFVGEAPGAEEDVQGEPFVGQAGRLLDNMLMAIKLKRGSNAYIANVVKCRPPSNRNPHEDEIAACMPYLKRQIELVQPKVIVALGKVAATALLGKDVTVSLLRGQVHEYKGIPLVITFHPAYLLRLPMEKAKAWEDLRLALETMRRDLNN